MPNRPGDGHEVASFEVGKATRFFRQLTAYPFLAFVVDEEGKVHVYAKDDLGEEDILQIVAELTKLIEE